MHTSSFAGPASLYALPARILTKDQLLDIAKTVLGMSVSDTVKIQIQHMATAVTRIANNRVLTSDNGDKLTIRVETNVGSRVSIQLDTNQIDESTLRLAVQQLDALARVQVGSPYDYMSVPTGPQEYMSVKLWHDATADAMATVGDTVVPGIIQSVKAAGLRGAGFVGLMARSTLAMQNDGLVAYEQETDSECSVSARTPDGKSSGWAGKAERDWSEVSYQEIATEAIDMAKRGANAVGYEPGRRTTILSPYAVAQVMRHVTRHFDAYFTNVLKATAFSVRGDPERRNKVNLRVFDEKIRIYSDPADSEGGYLPFLDTRYDSVSLPQRRMDWVEQGILKRLAYSVYYGLSEGQEFSQNPYSMRMESEPGTALKSVDEMIADCEEGIYVHRLSNVDQIDGITGMQTGVTRDGCFLIKRGKIDRPVKNYRYTDSPFMFLNRLLAMGESKRVAMGFTAPGPGEPSYASDWPRRPMIMPPVMVRDFNFSALAEVV